VDDIEALNLAVCPMTYLCTIVHLLTLIGAVSLQLHPQS
jgi:hypothetical protein